ncbi:hypothetical protein EKH55_5702 (plasmid) [Sinorhizobium alkalisoli]|nr:hypothetical protein EKH55_5702 [Sinorhizobium alkalisoli]
MIMASSGYTYEISLKLVRARDGSVPTDPASLTFEHVSHDDILGIVERMRNGSGLDSSASAAVAVGTKLLGEVMIRDKKNPLFDPLRAGLHEFITSLKQKTAT